MKLGISSLCTASLVSVLFADLFLLTSSSETLSGERHLASHVGELPLKAEAGASLKKRSMFAVSQTKQAAFTTLLNVSLVAPKSEKESDWM